MKRAGVVLLLCACASALPRVANAQEPSDAKPSDAKPSDPDAPAAAKLATPPPPQIEDDVLRYPPSSVRVGLIAGGLGLMLGAYGLSALFATSFDDVPGADALLVPVVGPWVSLFQNDCAPDDPDCGAILVLRGILLVLDGLAQGGGVAIAAEGLFMTTEADEPADAASAGAFMVVPTVGPHHAGFGVLGTF